MISLLNKVALRLPRKMILIKVLLLTTILLGLLPFKVLAQTCNGVADLWIANDETVGSTQIMQSLDFWYQLSDQFFTDDVLGVKGGGIGWDGNTQTFALPISQQFGDSDGGDSGVSDGNFDGVFDDSTIVRDLDNLGLRKNYTSKVSGSPTSMSPSIDITVATTTLTAFIDDDSDDDMDGVTNNGRRLDIPQVAVILVGSSLQLPLSITTWGFTINQLINAGPNGVSVHLLLVEAAAQDYNDAGLSVKAEIDAIAINPDVSVVVIDSYLELSNTLSFNHVGDLTTSVCNQSLVSLSVQQAAIPLYSDTAPYLVTFTFGEAVTGFDDDDSDDVDIEVQGDSSAALSSFATNSATEYTVMVTPDMSEEDITVAVPLGVATVEWSWQYVGADRAALRW